MDGDREETHIIEGIKTGKDNAYRKLFELYYTKLVVFAVKYIGDPESARDIVQDFLLYLYESRDSITVQTSLKAYLYSSVRNRCLNHLKHEEVREKHRDSIRHAESGQDQDPDLVEKMDATELESRIFEIVSRMPEQCRRIYTLSRVYGKRNREIADELDISIRTVETQISRALKALRNSLLPGKV